MCAQACVRKCGHVYVLSVQVSKMHIHTLIHTHMHTAKTDTVCLSHSQPWLQAQMWRTFFFFSFFPFVFGVALFYTCTFYLLFFLVFTRWWNTTELYVLPQIGTSHTAKRYSCGGKKGDLNKHKLNLRFVPNCFMMFSIWHLSKLLYMRGTFIVRDCLCVWAIIF